MTDTQTDSGTSEAAVESIEYTSTSHPAPEEGAVETVETPTTDEGQEPADGDKPDDGTKPETDEQQKAPQKKKSGGFQRKIDRLSHENAQLQAQVQKLQQPQSPTPEQKPAGNNPDKEPVLTDFDDVLDFIDAKADWKAKQAVKTYDETKTQEAQRLAADAEYQSKQQAYNEKFFPLIEQTPEVIDQIQQYMEAGLVTPQLENAVLDSPIGEKITLHLVNNPNELIKYRGLNEAQTYRQVALLEASLSSNQNGQQVAAVRTTQAAAPIKPIGKQASTASKAPSEMSQSEYEAWRYPVRN